MRASPDNVSRDGLVLDHPADSMPNARRDLARAEVAPGSAPSEPGAATSVRRPQPADLIGETFGQWRVVGFAGSTTGRPRWCCVCTCGKRRDVLAFHLTSGISKSCGCQRADHRLGTRSAAAGRSEALLELLEVLERHVRKCEQCVGTGTLKEHFDAYAVVQVVGDWRPQAVPIGRAVQRIPCHECGEIRLAIQRVQEFPA